MRLCFNQEFAKFQLIIGSSEVVGGCYHSLATSKPMADFVLLILTQLKLTWRSVMLTLSYAVRLRGS